MLSVYKWVYWNWRFIRMWRHYLDIPWYPRYLSPLPPFLEGCIPPDGLRLHEYVHIDSDISFQASFGLLKPPFTVPHLPTQIKIYFGEMQPFYLGMLSNYVAVTVRGELQTAGIALQLGDKALLQSDTGRYQDTSLLPEAIWISWFQPELTFELDTYFCSLI